MLHKILGATALDGQQLRLDYADGSAAIVDFAPVIRIGRQFARLGDPAFFAQVSAANNGRSITWPGEIDFCADALWREGHGERVLGGSPDPQKA